MESKAAATSEQYAEMEAKKEARRKQKMKDKFIPATGRCKYLIPKKQRICGQPTDKISPNFCRFHMTEDELKDRYVPCPNEPKFFLPESQLAAHLKKCPKVKLQADAEQKPWYKAGINFMNSEIQTSFRSYFEEREEDYDDDEVVKRDINELQLKDVDQKLRETLMEKVDAFYTSLKEKTTGSKFTPLFQVDEVWQRMEAELAELGEEEVKMTQFFKHSNQQANIISLMQKHQLLLDQQPSSDEPYIYVEFGAGRAGLSSFVALKLIELENKANVFLAIDRDARKFKHDKDFKDHMLSFRERLDIADFDLKTFINEKLKNDVIKGKDYKIIAIAKHLCGGATDLALTSMKLQDPERNLGVTIATCCHHLCDAKTYVNLPYLKEHFNEIEINILTRFSSWAISPQVSSEKRRLGFKTKRILDYGRCLFIENTLGMEMHPYQYCDPLKESPENILLLAVKK